MPDHGVQGVDRAVAEQARQPGHRTPEQRCDDRVPGVLGHRFDGGPGQLVGPEGARVAADQAADPLPGGGQVVGGEQLVDGGRLPAQAAPAQYQPGRGDPHREPQRGGPGHPVQPHRGDDRAADQKDFVRHPGGPGVPPAAPLELLCQAAETGDRVPAPRVAEGLVGEPAEQQRGEGHGVSVGRAVAAGPVAVAGRWSYGGGMSNPYGPKEKLTAEQAVEAMPKWRLVHGRMHLVAKFSDFRRSLEFVNRVGELAEEMNHHPEIDIRYNKVHLALSSHDVGGISGRDVDLAAAIVPVVKVSDGQIDLAGLSETQIAIDAQDIAAILPFWQAVYGYDQVDDDELVDPNKSGPSIWFQPTDERRDQRNRIHIDVDVPADQAEQRVQAVLDAGGRLVTDQYAPAWWVLADAEGNEACVCTFQSPADSQG
ncbi:4a-hydroxytetrahydrobiopterin dehydratase [Enemella evansiae]|nr:4a-hydroxytetrahydrobiopterin dehydratase [Enemella evansiae]